ncbi:MULTISPECIES: Hpt domain-containing protein [Pseudomonas]|uniref:Hpt domain-containing protein n=1 Tax=Pseudomonas kribbensis TaxID=1628086 RepID=A0A4Y8VM17_9PSED|nr:MULTISPECIES: Hpt domain-containing protein [Pseudomonas]MDL5595498.1 Hpt domain-containing protein [Bacillus subtilis]TFH81381.1 Hpt domain-containing protein [Pseudomonas kribbensis]
MTDACVDRDVLSALQEVMEDGYPELLDTFLADSEARLRELQKTADADALSSVAHSFKGSSSNMGATRLAELCQELEQHARDKSPSEIIKLVADIHDEFADVRPVYEAERQRSPAH